MTAAMIRVRVTLVRWSTVNRVCASFLPAWAVNFSELAENARLSAGVVFCASARHASTLPALACAICGAAPSSSSVCQRAISSAETAGVIGPGETCLKSSRRLRI